MGSGDLFVAALFKLRPEGEKKSARVQGQYMRVCVHVCGPRESVPGSRFSRCR